MPRFGRDGKRIVQRTPEPGPPRELPGAIDRLTVSFRELNDKRDRLEGDVDKFRRRLAEAEGQLDQLQRSWWPSQLDTKQRLEQYRDKLRTHLDAVSSELDATKASIPQARAALVRHYAVAQASRQPVEALTVPCPVCGQPSIPRRVAAAGRGWRKGWYECPADECDAAWLAKWSGGAHPAVRMAGLLIRGQPVSGGIHRYVASHLPTRHHRRGGQRAPAGAASQKREGCIAAARPAMSQVMP